MCQLCFFINRTWSHFLTLSTLFIIFFNVKFCFCDSKEPILFLEIFQRCGVSRRVLGEWVPPFQRTVLPSSSRVNCLTPDDEGNTILRNVGNYTPKTRRGTPEQRTPVQQGCDGLKTPSRCRSGQTAPSQGSTWEYNMWNLRRSPSNRAVLHRRRLVPWTLVQAIYIFQQRP
jgi:hypothetical protein